MRVFKSMVILLVLSLLAVSCTTTKTPEEKKAAKYASYIKRGYTEKEAEVFSMDRQELREFLSPFYGIPADKESYTYADKSVRNTIYAFVEGNYMFSFPDKEAIRRIADNHGDIVSFFTNAVAQRGTGYPTRNPQDELPDYRVLFENQIRAVIRIKEIHDQLYKDGYLNESMSEYHKASVISDRIWWTLGQQQTPTKSLETDSAYNCLYGLGSNCGARSAVYTMLLHLEGIQAQTMPCVSTNPNIGGHMLTRAILDGTEYYIDWANSFRGIRTPEEWATWNPRGKDNYIFNEEIGIRLF